MLGANDAGGVRSRKPGNMIPLVFVPFVEGEGE